MVGRLQLWRMLGAMAVLAALWLVPSVASAHGGHTHAHHGNMAGAMSQPAAPAARYAAIQAVQELTEADAVTPVSADAHHEPGVCSNGPCTGCHSFLVMSLPAPVPPVLSSIVRPDDPPPHLGVGGTKLRRPPKSLV